MLASLPFYQFLRAGYGPGLPLMPARLRLPRLLLDLALLFELKFGALILGPLIRVFQQFLDKVRLRIWT